MLVNKTVEFFLSEVAGWARCRGTGIGWQPDVTAANRCWVEADAGGAEAWQAASSEQDADGCRGWAGSGQMLGRDRRREVPRLGWQRNLQGSGRRRENHRGRQRARSEMPVGAEAGTGSGKITGAGGGLGARCRRGPRLGWQRNLQGPR